MKKINMVLGKCKSLRLGRSLSKSSLRSKSTKEEPWKRNIEDENCKTIFVGSTRKPYVVNSRFLTHPLLNALIEKSKQESNGNYISVRCEVVLFDHLLWMLENADPKLSNESIEELVELYAF